MTGLRYKTRKASRASARDLVQKNKCYDMTYACKGKYTNLCFKLEDGILTGTVLDNPSRKWRFVERNEDSFHWQNITVLDNGEIKVNSEIYAHRKVI